MINLHIVGAQKAGTSALAHFLSQHPDICLVKGKEAHVFDHPQFLRNSNKMQFAKQKYRSLLAHYDDEKYCADATPITLFQNEFLQHCAAFNPDAKCIVILRDPVERAASHYAMSLARGEESQNMLFAFMQESKRLEQAKDNWQFNSPLRTQSYLSRGCYTQQLRNLYAAFPAEQVLVLFNEQLQNEHSDTLQRVFDFLQLPHIEIASEQVFVGTKTQASLATRFIKKLAKSYARFYLWRKGESMQQWQQVIAQETTQLRE